LTAQYAIALPALLASRLRRPFNNRQALKIGPLLTIFELPFPVHPALLSWFNPETASYGALAGLGQN